MTESNCNQNNVAERPFSDFIYAMTRYEYVINGHRQAELVGETTDIQQLQQNARDITETLLLGLQSMGALMANAVENSETTIKRRDIIDAGHLINLLAECAFSVNDIAMQTTAELHRRNSA